MIGKVGRTGIATGNHLHYEIAEAGRQIDPSRARTSARRGAAGRGAGRLPGDTPGRSRCWPAICSRCRRWRRPNSPGHPLPLPWRVPLRDAPSAVSGRFGQRRRLDLQPVEPRSTRNCSPSWMRPSSSRLASGSCRFRWITRFSGRAP